MKTQELTQEQLIDAIFKAVGSEATYERCINGNTDPIEWLIHTASSCRTLRDELWEERQSEWKKAHEHAIKIAGVDVESNYIKTEDLRKLSIGEIADKIAEIETY